jgi:hypothetical protein
VDVPVVGVVLTAAEDMPSSYRYYRERYYTDEAPKRQWLPWRRSARQRPNGQTPETAPTVAGAKR